LTGPTQIWHGVDTDVDAPPPPKFLLVVCIGAYDIVICCNCLFHQSEAACTVKLGWIHVLLGIFRRSGSDPQAVRWIDTTERL